MIEQKRIRQNLGTNKINKKLYSQLMKKEEMRNAKDQMFEQFVDYVGPLIDTKTK